MIEKRGRKGDREMSGMEEKMENERSRQMITNLMTMETSGENAMQSHNTSLE